MMKKTRLIGKKALSCLLSVSLLLTPLGTRCFAEKVSEKAKQEKLENQKEEMSAVEWIAYIAAACIIVWPIWMLEERLFSRDRVVLKQATEYVGGFIFK